MERRLDNEPWFYKSKIDNWKFMADIPWQSTKKNRCTYNLLAFFKVTIMDMPWSQTISDHVFFPFFQSELFTQPVFIASETGWPLLMTLYKTGTLAFSSKTKLLTSESNLICSHTRNRTKLNKIPLGRTLSDCLILILITQSIIHIGHIASLKRR